MRCCQPEAPSFPQTNQTELCPQVCMGSALPPEIPPDERQGEVYGGCGTTTEEIAAI